MTWMLMFFFEIFVAITMTSWHSITMVKIWAARTVVNMITTAISLIQPLLLCLIKKKVLFFLDAFDTHSFETSAPILATSRSMTIRISTFFVFKHVFYMVQEMIMLMTMLTSPSWEARVSLNTLNWKVEFFIFLEEIVAEWVLPVEIV